MTRTGRAPLVIVNSGAYIHQELSAEFGELPPAFLPLGHGRLYELQQRMLSPLGGELHLTLPASFELAAWDAERLKELGFTVLRTPDDLPLGAAVLHALSQVGFEDRPLRLLHGDTLLAGLDLAADDAVAVFHGGDGYRWGHVRVGPGGDVERFGPPGGDVEGGDQRRLCGYFALSSLTDFAASLTLHRGDMFAALNARAAQGGLQALTPSSWLDFGHVQTFFRSRRIVTTARAFNSLEVGEMHVRKRSASASGKLRAEARWLREAPRGVAPFCARLLSEGEDAQGYFYDTEYEYMPTLAELYVFGRLGPDAWSRVLESCGHYVSAAVEAGAGGAAPRRLHRLAVGKTAERLELYATAAGLDLDAENTLNGAPAPALRRCLHAIEAVVERSPEAPSVMHGDLCFSNILYSFRTDRVRLIDPRGITETGEFSLYGDAHYDLAKLMHSVCGRYDLILAGQFKGGRTGAQAFDLAFPDDARRVEVERLATGMTMGGVALGSDVVWAVMTSLFLSMAPLHADRPDRQGAFIANALRLHAQLEGARAA